MRDLIKNGRIVDGAGAPAATGDVGIRDAIGFSSVLSATHNEANGQSVSPHHASFDEILNLVRAVGSREGTSIEFLPGVAAGWPSPQKMCAMS